MKLRCLYIIFLLFSAQSLFAQSRKITGIVKDAETHYGLEYISIGVLNSNIGTYSNVKGAFNLEIPEKIKFPRLIISYLGYEIDTISLLPKKNDYIIYLKPKQELLNEVVVTGVSKATLIKENPISVIQISPKALEYSNESNIIDKLVKSAPGLNAVKTGPNISKPFIRGLGYNRVLTLYDGVRQEGQQWGDEHGIEVDAYNINKAEVFKGPASLMYGSDALAGIVSLFPLIPSEGDGKIHGKFTSEYQTNNNLIGNGLRLGYSTQHFLFAMRGSYRIAKNYRNAIDGRVYNSSFNETNLSTLFGFKTKRGYSHFNFTLYDNLQGIPDGSRDSESRKFTKQIFEGDDDDIKNRQIVSNQELNSYKLAPLHQHITHYRLYSHNAYQLRFGDIDALFALQQNIRSEFNHPTMPEKAGMKVRLNTLNYNLRYNIPKFKNIETTLGINGMLQNNMSIEATDFPIPDYDLMDGGMFLFAKWKVNKWTVSGGARYDMRKIFWDDFYTGTQLETGFAEKVTHIQDPNAELTFPAYTRIFKGTSASIGVTYQLNNIINLKANVGRGYRAPNIPEIASNGLDPGAHIIYLGNRSFNPEFSLQEDFGVGIKYPEFTAELSMFNNNLSDYIYLTMLVDAQGNPLSDAQGNKTYQYQQAEAQLYGMEAWFSFQPQKLKGLTIESSISQVTAYNRKAEFVGKGIQGEYLPLIPPTKILGSISQKMELKSRLFAFLLPKVEVEHNSAQSQYLALNNTETFTEAYTLINISMSSEIKFQKGRNLFLQFQVNNLFDVAYQSNLSRLKYFEYYDQSAKGHSGMYNMGRNICLKVSTNF